MRETLSEWRETAYSAVREQGVPTVMVALLMLSVVAGVVVVTQPMDGGQSGTASAADGDELWNASTGDNVESSPTIVDGTVYIGSDDGSLYAFDADTGDEKWSASTGGEIVSSPTVSEGTVYVGSGDNSTYAFDADSGEEEWSYETGDSIESSPTVKDGTVYVGSGDNSTYAVDADSGDEEWEYETGDYILSSPTVTDGNVYIGSGDENVYALNASDGNEEWSYATENYVDSSPTVVNGTVYAASDDGSVYALDGQTGDEEWSTEILFQGIDDSSPTVSNGSVFVGSNDGLHSLDVETGDIEWTGGVDDDIELTSPTISNGNAYIGTDAGTMYSFDAETGDEEWTFDSGSEIVRSSPTVAGGVVYFGSDDGSVHAVDTGHSEDSTDSRVELHTLGHVGPVEEGEPTPTPTEPESELSLDTRSLFTPNSTHPYSVTLDDEGDVTDNASVTSSNESVLTVDEMEHTLTSANLSEAATVDVTANYTAEDGEDYTVTNEIVVGNATVENLEVLPGGTWRTSAVIGDSFMQTLLVALFAAVMMGRFTSAFGGLAAAEMVLVIGWFAGYVPWVYAALGLFVAMFIGLNLAANIDYTVRR